jgi:hypothetical protein
MSEGGVESGTPFLQKAGALWLLCCFLAVAAGLILGQDANWDLRNYHFYNPYAWLNNRYDIDIAPAQIQTWHYPLADIPYYLFARAGVSSWISTSVLALPAAVALYVVARIYALLVPGVQRGWIIFALLLVALTGTAGLPVIGSTMSEWHTVALFLGAMWLLLKPHPDESDDWMRFVFAGALGGAAVGFKLTAAVYAIGLAAMVLALPGPAATRLRRLAFLGIGGAGAFVLVFAPWGWFVYQRMESPVFPYFNNVFGSSYALPLEYKDSRFAKTTLEAIATLPFRLMRNTTSFVSEVTMRDWRLALGFPALFYLAWRPDAASLAWRYKWRALLVFFVVSYVLWAGFYGIYRYAGILELTVALALIACAATIRPARALLAVAIVSVVVIAAAKQPRWWRLPHGPPVVVAALPELPAGSMVVMATLEPLGYVVPNLPPAIPVISIINNIMIHRTAMPRLHDVALQRIRAHAGPIWRLTRKNGGDEQYYKGTSIDDITLGLGLRTDRSACLGFSTPLDSDLQFCPITKVAP